MYHGFVFSDPARTPITSSGLPPGYGPHQLSLLHLQQHLPSLYGRMGPYPHPALYPSQSSWHPLYSPHLTEPGRLAQWPPGGAADPGLLNTSIENLRMRARQHAASLGLLDN